MTALTTADRQRLNQEATDFTGQCLVAITALTETMAWRSNSGVAVTPTKNIVRMNVPGVGDITGGRRGFAFTVECKLRSGTPNANQKRFRLRWEMAGNIYIIAKTIDQVVEDLLAATSGPMRTLVLTP